MLKLKQMRTAITKLFSQSEGLSAYLLRLLATGIMLIQIACGLTALPEATVPAQPTPLESEVVSPPTPSKPEATTTPSSEASPSPVVIPLTQPVRAWSIAADGAIFVLDASQRLYQLAPDDLSPLTQSPPLFETSPDAATYLLAGESYLFVSSPAVSQTLVLNRNDFSQVATLDQAGPMALDPGQRLLLLPRTATLPLYTAAIWVYDLADLNQPPQEIQRGCTFARSLTADPQARQLYLLAHGNCSSPPHQEEAHVIYDLDTLTEIGASEYQLGTLTRPALAERTSLIVTTLSAKNGLFSGSTLMILDRQGQELKTHQPLDGIPAIDTDGDWLYLLRQRGLWVLNGHDLSLRGILPFTATPPADLMLSPDGQTLYLFGNGWLEALATTELQSLGIPTLNSFPTVWNEADPNNPSFARTRLYRSPTIEEDGVAFVQVGSYSDYFSDTQETYRTTDGGRTWHFLTTLTYPDYYYVGSLSLSPDFASDHTLTAHTGSAILRSTDGGDTWREWVPQIAFVSERDGNREIYTMNQEGNDLRRLTNSPAAEENPAWSPAWTRLAFQSNQHGNWDIFTMRTDCDLPLSLDGEVGQECDLRQLTTDPADDLLPAWSPDGRFLAFVSTRDGNPEIYVMDSDGQNQRRLTFQPTGDWRPAWLPDSQHLIFTSDYSGNNDLYQLTVPPPDAPLTAESEILPIVTDPADDRDPAIGDRGELFFLSDRDGVMRVYRLDLRASYATPSPATETSQPEGHPSPVGTSPYTILVTAERDGVSDIYRVIGSEYTPLTSTPVFDGQPAWGPVLWQSVSSMPESGDIRLK